MAHTGMDVGQTSNAYPGSGESLMQSAMQHTASSAHSMKESVKETMEDMMGVGSHKRDNE